MLRRVSEWHVRWLMDQLAQSSMPQQGQERLHTGIDIIVFLFHPIRSYRLLSVRSALISTSTALESLHAATGVHTLLVSFRFLVCIVYP